MDDKLYLIDLYNVKSADENFCAFFTDFMQNHQVGIVTDVSSIELPYQWIQKARYAFCSDGHELYINNRLRYKNVLTYTREVSAWVSATQLPVTNYAHKLHIKADPYNSAALVRSFNELFTEYTAYSCTGGLCISDNSNPRRHIDALISSNYTVSFISHTALLGGVSFELATHCSKRGTVYAVDSYKDLQELLTNIV